MTLTHTGAARSARPFTATALGAPRIGPNRELKKAVEAYWAGTLDRRSLRDVAAGLRRDDRARMTMAGFDSVPTNTFSYYDQVLDTAVLLGALPARVEGVEDPLDRYFAAARGREDVTPLEMTKWFDTNYHYLVPEIGADTVFSLHAENLLAQVRDAVSRQIPARPVVIGPVTFLLLSKSTDGSDLLARVDELVPLYTELLGDLRAAGAEWVQIDEPALVADRTDAELAAVDRVYRALTGEKDRPQILIGSYFGYLGAALPVLAGTGVEAIAVDLVAGTDNGLERVPALAETLLVAGVVDGRNIWRTDLQAALATLGRLTGLAGKIAVSTSCSLLHVPYSLEPETGLDAGVRDRLAFGAEKTAEVALLAAALGGDEAAQGRIAETGVPPAPAANAQVRERQQSLTAADAARTDGDRRRKIQQGATPLPLLPTTTIGSFPQTDAIRGARGALRRGKIDRAEYDTRMKAEIAAVVELQERLGIDVLVHGEPERNDMVQYFAEQLDGFATTAGGWVQSYGSRCTRPSILFGDVHRPAPITVDWATYAQSLTPHPVKGMLTGPVTILAWSFVRDDQPLGDTAAQVGLALRDEVRDLEAAGIRIVQVDEPALRELLPLRQAAHEDYLDW